MDYPVNHKIFLSICLVTAIACSEEDDVASIYGFAGPDSDSGEAGSEAAGSAEAGSAESAPEAAGSEATMEIAILPEPLLSLCPVHTSGDTEFFGNGPSVTAAVEFVIINDTLVANIDFSMIETQADWSSAEYHESHLLWAPASDCQIMSILTDAYSDCSYTDSDLWLDSCWPAEKGGVHEFQFVGDTLGADLGSCGPHRSYANVYFNPMKLLVHCQ
jgi:hypothetical protein